MNRSDKTTITGDYTLYIGGESSGRKTNFIEYKEERSGTAGGKPIKTYYIKYASNRFPGEYEYIGIINSFILRDNAAGIKTEYRIGNEPKQI